MDTHDHGSVPFAQPSEPALPAGTPTLDSDKYLPRIRHRFVSDEEAHAWLSVMWGMIVTMVDFGMDLKTSPVLLHLFGETSSEAPRGALECAHNPKQQFDRSAAPVARKSDSND